MSSEGIIAVSAAVVALVQLWKWAGLRDSWGPLAVIALSVVGVLIWLVSGDSWPPARTDIWPIFSGIVAVTLSSAGVFGFTRATAAAVTSAKAPPADGAGSSATVKADDSTLTVGAVADELERRRDERVQARLRAANQTQPPYDAQSHPPREPSVSINERV